MRPQRIAILGGGMAGTSLAYRLCAPAFADCRVDIYEPRPPSTRDRTWCYFALHPHPFTAAIARRWPRCRVAYGGHETILEAPGIGYEMIPADRFYAVANARIETAAHMQIHRSAVHALRSHPGGWQLAVGGAQRDYDLVFDSRPPPLSLHAWSQHIHGIEIETPHDVFDPGIATLMDFAEPHRHAIEFTYLLPLSPRRALIENTWFVAPGAPPPPLATAWKHQVERRLGIASWRECYRETGVIAMNPLLSRESQSAPGYLPIGTRAGWSRGATGYTFLETQRACDRISAGLQRGGNLARAARPPRPWYCDPMDRLLLRALRHDPRVGPRWFMQLFGRAPFAAVARFLGGTGSLGDALQVIRALPAVEFSRALLALAKVLRYQSDG